MNRAEIKAWVAAQDWSLRDSDIARVSGKSIAVVRTRRMRAGIPRGTKSLRVGKWEGVDWSKPDTELAKERGVSRQCVNFYRKKYAASNAN